MPLQLAEGRRGPEGSLTLSIDTLKDRLPVYACDIKLNLSSLASEQLLSPQQKAGSFIAAALAGEAGIRIAATVHAAARTLAAEEALAPALTQAA
ncbi:MAG: hypothetical protein ACHQPH_06050 [Reyranellales bacterium]